MYGFIYLTTNLINGKKYIGMCSYQRRGHKSYLGSGKLLMSAVTKYGRSNFSRVILQDAETKEEAFELEQRYILEHNAVDDTNYYNLLEGKYKTKGFRGKKNTEDSNRRRSDALKGIARPQHVRDILRQANIGRPASENQRSASVANGRKRARSVTIDGVTYRTIGEAAKALGKSQGYISTHYPVNPSL